MLVRQYPKKKRVAYYKKATRVPKTTKSYVNRVVNQRIDKEETDLSLIEAPITNSSGIIDLTQAIYTNNPLKEYTEVKNMSMEMRMRINPRQADGTYRIIIFKWKDDTAHYQPSADDILQIEDVISPYVKQDLRSKFSVLMDKTFTHGGATLTGGLSDLNFGFPQKYHRFTFNKRLGDSQFNNIFTSGVGSNHYHILFVGSTKSTDPPLADSPFLDFNCRQTFIKL
jgi:hypothetical protein